MLFDGFIICPLGRSPEVKRSGVKGVRSFSPHSTAASASLLLPSRHLLAMMSNSSGPEELLETMQRTLPDQSTTSQLIVLENVMKFLSLCNRNSTEPCRFFCNIPARRHLIPRHHLPRKCLQSISTKKANRTLLTQAESRSVTERRNQPSPRQQFDPEVESRGLSDLSPPFAAPTRVTDMERFLDEPPVPETDRNQVCCLVLSAALALKKLSYQSHIDQTEKSVLLLGASSTFWNIFF